MKPKRKRILITRDKNGVWCDTWAHGTKLSFSEDGIWYGHGAKGHSLYSSTEFRRIFRFLPRKGSKGVFAGTYREDGK